MWMKSKMERDEPKRVNPKTDKEEPNRAKLREEMEDPSWMKSRVDKHEPSRVMNHITLLGSRLEETREQPSLALSFLS